MQRLKLALKRCAFFFSDDEFRSNDERRYCPLRVGGNDLKKFFPAQGKANHRNCSVPDRPPQGLRTSLMSTSLVSDVCKMRSASLLRLHELYLRADA